VAPFSVTFPVRFADVDHAGIVYYPRFHHYFHIAFEEFFRQRVGPAAYMEILDRRRIGFPAVHSSCDYRAPLRFGDLVRIDMDIEQLGGKSIRFRYRALRAEGDSGQLVAEGVVVVAVTNLAEFRAIEIPDDLRQLFLELVADPG
jgi:4-hydroxybenzoyl-CoA thioesterase